MIMIVMKVMAISFNSITGDFPSLKKIEIYLKEFLFKYIASIPRFFASILNSFIFILSIGQLVLFISIFNSTFPFFQIIYQTVSTTCFACVYSS